MNNKFTNAVQIAVGDMAYLEFSCMINGNKSDNTTMVMTYENLKKLQDAINQTTEAVDKQIAEKKKSN